MITSICLNPSFDRTVNVDAIQIGQMNRCQASREDMGGKGINVSVVVNRLGMKNCCLGFLGEENGDRLRRMLDKEGITFDFIPVPGMVRTNVKILAGDGSGVTELNEPGPTVSPLHIQKIKALVKEKAQQSRYMVFTGSTPSGCGEMIYRDLMMAASPVPCVLDAVGPLFMQGLSARPYLVKPNQDELQATLRLKLRTLREMRDAAFALIQKGVQNVIVSMGKYGALFTDGKRTYFAPSLKVKACSTVGAGDAMLGGVLFGLEKGEELCGAFRYGVAAGAASVMTDGTQLINVDDFNRLLSQVKIQEV